MAHLTLLHRQQIAEGIRSGKSNTRIARELCVHPSTVGREIARNSESREQYAAQYAHNMAACRQIRAARDRFICAAEVYVPSKYLPNLSPFSGLTLPPLYYGRPMHIGGYSESFYQNTYYYKGSYPAFARFGQVSGIFKISGQSQLSRPRWTSVCRNTDSSDKLSFKNLGKSTDIFKRGNDMVISGKNFIVNEGFVKPSLSKGLCEIIFKRGEVGSPSQKFSTFFRPEYSYLKKPLVTKGKSLVLF